jgi:hypothetical protein
MHVGSVILKSSLVSPWRADAAWFYELLPSMSQDKVEILVIVGNAVFLSLPHSSMQDMDAMWVQ